MSLFDHALHEHQAHAEEAVCVLQSGAPVCFACFAETVSDPQLLSNRRHYVVRQLLDLAAAHPALLPAAAARHADLLVSRLLAALAADGAADAELGAALLDALAALADAAPHFVPELATDRGLQLLADPACWEFDASRAPCSVGPLRLVSELAARHAPALSLALARFCGPPQLSDNCLAALAARDAWSAAPALGMLEVLLGRGRAAHMRLPLAGRAFSAVLGLLPDARGAALRLQCLGLLLDIAEANPGALELMDSSAVQQQQQQPTQHMQQQHSQHSQSQAFGTLLGSCSQQHAAAAPVVSVLASLQSCLLQPNAPLQAAAARLLGALARQAPPRVVAQLVEDDACEYLFELIRGTLAASPDGGGSSVAPRAAAGAAAFADEREALQCCAAAALRQLSHAGAPFARRLPFGLDALVSLAAHAAAVQHVPLLAETLSVLTALCGGGGEGGGGGGGGAGEAHGGGGGAAAAAAAAPLSRATMRRLALMLESVLPEPADGAGIGELVLAPDLDAAYAAACQLAAWLAAAWPADAPSQWPAASAPTLGCAQRALGLLALLDVPTLAVSDAAVRASELVAAIATALGSMGGGGPNPPLSNLQQEPPSNDSSSRSSIMAADELSKLMQGACAHLVPALVRMLNGAGLAAGAAAASPAAAHRAQRVTVAAPAMLRAVAALFEASAALAVPSLQAAAAEFAARLLGDFAWPEVIDDVLALLALQQPSAAPAAAVNTNAAAAWRALLAAAATADGLGLATPSHCGRLAAALGRRSARLPDILDVLSRGAGDAVTNSSGGRAAARGARGGGKGGGSGGSAGSGGDIRRFCGITDAQRAALLVLHAVVHRGGNAGGSGGGGCGAPAAMRWQLGQVLEGLNGLVGSAGPAFAAQPELLIAVARLYAAVEEQLVLALHQQGSAASPPRPLAPPAICAALQRASAWPLLAPGDAVAGWLLSHAAEVPAVVQRLLATWMAAALPPPWGPPAAAEMSVANVACALATAAPDALLLLPGAAAAVEQRLAAAAAGDEPRDGAPAAAAAAAAVVHLAVVARVLQLRPGLLGFLLRECQLAQLLRRRLLEHSVGSNGSGSSSASFSALVAVACCAVLQAAAAAAAAALAANNAAAARDLAELEEAAGPLLHLAAARLRALGGSGGGGTNGSAAHLRPLQLSLLNAANALSFCSLLSLLAAGTEPRRGGAPQQQQQQHSLISELVGSIFSADAPPPDLCNSGDGAGDAGVLALSSLLPLGDAVASAHGGHLLLAALQHSSHSCIAGALAPTSSSAVRSGVVAAAAAASAQPDGDGYDQGQWQQQQHVDGVVDDLTSSPVLDPGKALLIGLTSASGAARLLAFHALAFAALRGGAAALAGLPLAPLLCAAQNGASAAAQPLAREASQAALGALLMAAAAGSSIVGVAGNKGAAAAAAAAELVLASRWHAKLASETLGRACRVAGSLIHARAAGDGAADGVAGGGAIDGAAAVLEQPQTQRWLLLAGDLLFLTSMLEAFWLASGSPCPQPAPKQKRKAAAAAAAVAPAAADSSQWKFGSACAAAAADALERSPLLGLLCKAAAMACPSAALGVDLADGSSGSGAIMLGALCAARLLAALLRCGLLTPHAGRALEALRRELAGCERLSTEGSGGDASTDAGARAAAAWRRLLAVEHVGPVAVALVRPPAVPLLLLARGAAAATNSFSSTLAAASAAPVGGWWAAPACDDVLAAAAAGGDGHSRGSKSSSNSSAVPLLARELARLCRGGGWK